MSRRSDLWVGAVALGLGVSSLIAVPWVVPGANLASLRMMRSSAFFPLIVASILALLGLILVLSALRGPPGKTMQPIHAPLRVLSVAGTISVYVLVMPWLGMFSSSALTVLVLSLLLRERRWWLIILLMVITPVLVYILFEYYLLLLFPRGILF